MRFLEKIASWGSEVQIFLFGQVFYLFCRENPAKKWGTLHFIAGCTF
jgi:hypothetical protein